jgi:hypothetical protein
MILTRSDLEMMLDEMDKNNIDKIEVDAEYIGHNDNLICIDFNIYHDEEYHHTVLTLEP